MESLVAGFEDASSDATKELGECVRGCLPRRIGRPSASTGRVLEALVSVRSPRRGTDALLARGAPIESAVRLYIASAGRHLLDVAADRVLPGLGQGRRCGHGDNH